MIKQPVHYFLAHQIFTVCIGSIFILEVIVKAAVSFLRSFVGKLLFKLSRGEVEAFLISNSLQNNIPLCDLLGIIHDPLIDLLGFLARAFRRRFGR